MSWLKGFNRQLSLWTLVLAAAGYFYPPLLIWIPKGFINWFFCLTMFGIGLTLDMERFVPALKRPQWIFFGNAVQFTVMPLLGYTLASAFGFGDEIRIGFVLVGAVPGAMASNVISHLARADTAYSVLMTTFATILAPILTPSITYLLAGANVEVRFWAMSWQVLWMTVLPLIAGIYLRRMGRERFEALEPVSSALASFAIIVICAYIVAVNEERFAGLSLSIVAAVVLMNAAGMLFGYGAGRAVGFDLKRRRTLSFEIGMQNAGLGAVLAINNFAPESALPPALFATWCLLTASVFAGIWARREGDLEDRPPADSRYNRT